MNIVFIYIYRQRYLNNINVFFNTKYISFVPNITYFGIILDSKLVLHTRYRTSLTSSVTQFP